ncbi:MAG: hypothetical protein DI551_07835 [Micavibrio aeruginosavorus]|uniref:Lipoprotein n=1 Tax=Micavibrio aeruginosavorus TaxID=349221 RepID=A0A2W5MVN5_9BACT|nr:MAG: hypothetical protein DI551_07835 [Micavibrio aeruginosavorus]
MKKFTVLLAGLSALTLVGCVSQEQADVKMGEGCKAAISAMLEPDDSVKEFKSTSGAPEKTMGSVYRRIKVSYIQNDDFSEEVREGSCLFSEQWGFFKSSHAALLEQVAWDDQLVGKKDGVIEGDMNAFLKLTEKVDTAMGQ